MKELKKPTQVKPSQYDPKPLPIVKKYFVLYVIKSIPLTKVDKMT